MKVLITGATGYVGTTFLRMARERGWELMLVTRDRKRIGATGASTARVYEGEISDPELRRRIVSNEKHIDVVYHLASSLAYWGKWGDVYRTNVLGTRNMLQTAKDTGVQRFVYASSIEAAGTVRRGSVPLPTDAPPRPISTYGRSKLLAEREVLSAARTDLKTAVLRIGNVYGPDRVNIVTNIANAILNRTRVLEFLAHYQDRYLHPVHNDDIGEGFLAAADCGAERVVATLAGEYATVGRLFDIAAQVMGKTYQRREATIADAIYLRARRAYHKSRGSTWDFMSYMLAGTWGRVHRAYSVRELHEEIGFVPKWSLEDGMRDSIEWARAHGQLEY